MNARPPDSTASSKCEDRPGRLHIRHRSRWAHCQSGQALETKQIRICLASVGSRGAAQYRSFGSQASIGTWEIQEIYRCVVLVRAIIISKSRDRRLRLLETLEMSGGRCARHYVDSSPLAAPARTLHENGSQAKAITTFLGYGDTSQFSHQRRRIGCRAAGMIVHVLRRESINDLHIIYRLQ